MPLLSKSGIATNTLALDLSSQLTREPSLIFERVYRLDE